MRHKKVKIESVILWLLRRVVESGWCHIWQSATTLDNAGKDSFKKYDLRFFTFLTMCRNGDVKDKSVLLIGGRLSAEDVALQCHKHGSREVHVSYHTTPLGYLPSQEHPPITHFEGPRTAQFQDGSKADVDLVKKNVKWSLNDCIVFLLVVIPFQHEHSGNVLWERMYLYQCFPKTGLWTTLWSSNFLSLAGNFF